jgi:hypothetical protein
MIVDTRHARPINYLIFDFWRNVEWSEWDNILYKYLLQQSYHEETINTRFADMSVEEVTYSPTETKRKGNMLVLSLNHAIFSFNSNEWNEIQKNKTTSICVIYIAILYTVWNFPEI